MFNETGELHRTKSFWVLHLSTGSFSLTLVCFLFHRWKTSRGQSIDFTES